MYKEYNINLIYKFICLLIFLLTISFINNVYVLSILFLGLFFFNRKNNPLLFFMILLSLFFLILKIIDYSILMINVVLIIDYIIVFFMYVKKEDFILAKNTFFNKKYTYKELEREYIDDISSLNDNMFDEFVSVNNLVSNDDLLEIRERLVSKNKDQVYDKLVVNYLRFYKNKNDNFKYLGINRETLGYLGLHIIVFILAVIL